MIFVSVGMEKFPFNRLLQAVDEAKVSGEIKSPVFAQTGRCTYQPKGVEHKAFIDFAEMVKNIQSSDIVVLHAGVGSVLLSLTLGKIPIILPRRHDLGEHLDDHQLEFARKMDSLKRVIVAYSPEELIAKILNYPALIRNFPSLSSSRQALCEHLKEYVRSS